MNYVPDPMIWMTVTTTSIERSRELHLMNCYVTNRDLDWDLSLTTGFRREMICTSEHGMDHESIRDATYTIMRLSFRRPKQIQQERRLAQDDDISIGNEENKSP